MIITNSNKIAETNFIIKEFAIIIICKINFMQFKKFIERLHANFDVLLIISNENENQIQTRWCESVRYPVTVNRVSSAPEIATEAEILDQGVVYLDDGRGSESECRLMLSLCNVIWRCLKCSRVWYLEWCNQLEFNISLILNLVFYFSLSDCSIFSHLSKNKTRKKNFAL